MAKLLFYDNFNRPDTTAGAAGNTTSMGRGWVDVFGSTGSISGNTLSIGGGLYNQFAIGRPSQETPLAGRFIARVLIDSSGTTPIIRLQDSGQGTAFCAYGTAGVLSCGYFSAGGAGPFGTTNASYTASGNSQGILQLDVAVSGTSATATAKIFAGTNYIDQASCSVLVSSGGAAATPLASTSCATTGIYALTVPGHAGFSPYYDAGTVYEALVADTAPPSSQFAYTGSSLAFGSPLALTSNSPSGGLSFSWSPATGGSGTGYSYSLFRSAGPVNSSTGLTAIYSGTGLAYTDASPLPGVSYYIATVADSAGNVATSQQSTTQACFSALAKSRTINIINIGDSITYGLLATTGNSAASLLPGLIAEAFPTAQVNGGTLGTYNFGADGSTTVDWTNPSTGYLAAATKAIVPGQINVVTIMLGTNDAKASPNDKQTSPSAYSANIASICSAVIAAGGIPVLFSSPYLVPGVANEWSQIESPPLLLAYRDALVALADNATIYLGGSTTFEEFLSQYDAGVSIYGDTGVHPNNTGYAILSRIWAAGVSRVLAIKTGQMPSSGGIGAYTAASNVRLGTDRGDGTLGTLHVPTAAQVLSGVAVDATTGTIVLPAASSVVTTATFGAGSAIAGTVVLPTASQVESGITFGPGSGLTGTYTAAGGTFPTAAQVLSGIAFGPTANLTGTVVLPSAGQVQSGVTFGPGSGTTGTYATPGGSYPTTSQIASAVVAAMAAAPVGSVAAPVTVGTVNDKSGYALSSAGLDAIHVEVGINVRQALSPILAACAGVVAGAGTGVVVIEGGNTSTTRITATTDNAGNRSSVTLSLPT